MTAPRGAGLRAAAPPPIGDAGFDHLLAHLERRTGIAPSCYRRAALRRRLDVRLRVRGARSYPEYLRLLRTDPDERERLEHWLTIHVSRFFRNPESFRALERAVFPHLLRRADGRPLRIWSAGTAAGEEAYTLAMVWARASRRAPSPDSLQVIGTDLDAESLARAREALYDDDAVAHVSSVERRRWLIPEAGGHRVAQELRRCVRFRRHDLTRPRGVRLQDLVACRNVLIYFERSVQESLGLTFHRALRPGGFLMLGKAEMPVGAARAAFEVVDVRERLFRRRDA